MTTDKPSGVSDALAGLEAARVLAFENQVKPAFDTFMQEAKELPSYREYLQARKNLIPFDMAINAIKGTPGPLTTPSQELETAFAPSPMILVEPEKPAPVAIEAKPVEAQNEQILRETRQKIALVLNKADFPLTPNQLWTSLAGKLPGSMITRELIWMVKAKYVEEINGRYSLTKSGLETYFPNTAAPVEIPKPPLDLAEPEPQPKPRRVMRPTRWQGGDSVETVVIRLLREYGEPIRPVELAALAPEDVTVKSISATLSKLKVEKIVTHDPTNSTWTLSPEAKDAEPGTERVACGGEPSQGKAVRRPAALRMKLRDLAYDVIKAFGPLAPMDIADRIKEDMKAGKYHAFPFNPSAMYGDLFQMTRSGRIKKDHRNRYYV